MTIRRAFPAAAGLLMAGCTLTPHYERPAAPVSTTWPTGAAYAADYAGLPSASYRDLFGDERLQKLIALALENNRDLRQAAANVERARAQYRVQRAALFPQVNAGANVSTGSATGAQVVNNASANISVTAYELDLFGRLRSLNDSARNSYLASEAGAQAVRLSLIGTLAQAWLGYAADKSLLDLSVATAQAAGRSVDLTQARLSGGVAPRTDLRQAQTILATAQSDTARYTTATAQDRNLIELLVGAPVDPALLPDAIETAAERIAVPANGTGTDVLLRRPDVMSAEYNLRAANAQIGAARAALFPRITLGALIGLVGPSLERLFGDAGNEVSQGTAGASYSIFQGGAARANLAASKAQRDALLAAYEKAIQTAYRETADALARLGTIADQTTADRLRTEAARDAWQLAEARYRGGVDSFLQVLDAQRTYYAAQRTLVATQLEAATNRVTLYRALGGEAAAGTTSPAN
jgi:multidrug efflux system outer membrane protein